MRRLLALLALAIAGVLVPAGGASARACPGAGAQPNDHNVAKVRKATMCLLNQERTAAGLPKIHGNRKLARAAKRHSEDMVANGYFDHSSPTGSTLVSRVAAVHYVRPSAAWFLAENIAWGSGSLATPASIVDGWMHSPPHRENVLSTAARDAGVGIALGAPGGGPGATYTLDFGRTG